MIDNFEKSLKEVLKHEGGFVDHPKDPGGATNKGITIATFRKWMGKDSTVEQLKRITDDQVAHIYRKAYWNAVKGDELPSGIDYAVFDFGVNSGPARAIKYLQTVLSVTADGKIGPMTIAAAKSANASQVINALCDRRLEFLKALKTFATFGKGWTNRVLGVRISALDMVKAVYTAPKPTSVPYPSTPANSSPQKVPVPAIIAAFGLGAAGIIYFILRQNGAL